MAIEVNPAAAVCLKCGVVYGSKKDFHINYGVLYKGAGRLGICKKCVDNIYLNYLTECGDVKLAVRQTCRKLDLYWSERAFNSVCDKGADGAIMALYVKKMTTNGCMGKSYDDSLLEENALWRFGGNCNGVESSGGTGAEGMCSDGEDMARLKQDADADTEEPVSDEIVQFWGAGYTNRMYIELEQRKAYWLDKLPESTEFDIGTEAIIKQICALELDINRDRMAGKPVDKSVSVYNTLLGSACLKPTQKKEDTDTSFDKTPYGVWIRRFESERPIPDVDPELKDVDGIVKYITIWFFGHLAKMLNIKNSFSKLYEDEIEKLRVDHPEFDDDSDDDLLYNVFGGEEDGDGDSGAADYDFDPEP